MILILKEKQRDVFDLRVIKMKTFYHGKYLNYIKYETFGSELYAQTAHKMGQRICNVLSFIFRSQKQIKPTHMRLYKEMIINILNFVEKGYLNINFIDVSNHGFERNMVTVSDMIRRYLTKLDHEDTPKSILAKMHQLSWNKSIVDDIIKKGDTKQTEQSQEKQQQQLTYDLLRDLYHSYNINNNNEQKQNDNDDDIDDNNDEDDIAQRIFEDYIYVQIDQEITKRAEVLIPYSYKNRKKGNFCPDRVIPTDLLCDECECVMKWNGTDYCIDCQSEDVRKQIKIIKYLYLNDYEECNAEYTENRSNFLNLWSKATSGIGSNLNNDHLDDE